jgi:putative PIN family toxin of toxin-antitoxin system
LKLILDTNIVLDWLVFRDAGVAGLQPALDDGRIEIVTHEPAVVELRRVLAYKQFKLTVEQQQDLLARYNSHCRIVTLPGAFPLDNLGLPSGFPLCRDTDDQHFLALAYHERADALITKDAAVLELAKLAKKFGVTVLHPDQLAATLGDRGSTPTDSGDQAAIVA